MKRIFWPMVVMALFALRLSAQTSLEFFTNQANILLEQQFGFGITNIPIYSNAAPSNAYSSSWHYWLQAAANAYDATTPATNSPSVFRPLFGWTSNTLYIVGYTNVTTDFYAQIAEGFKQIGDPTITTNNNVWGIPWVVGMKGNPPAFNEYSYATEILTARKLMFVRSLMGNGQPDTNRPPIYTNQFFFLSVSNVFALEAWNYNRTNYPDPMTMVISNEISILITNNYDWGTNCQLSCATNLEIESWPGWTGAPSDSSLVIPLITNIIPLVSSYWSESRQTLVPLTPTNFASNNFLPGDLAQTGWPEHNWTLNISNDLLYALIDDRTGLLLDFVNLGGLGNTIPIIEVLTEQELMVSNDTGGVYWETNGASDALDSPMSDGVLNQIAESIEMDPDFGLELLGRSNIPGPTFDDPLVLSDMIIQASTYQADDPRVHYTLQDLTRLPVVSQLDIYAAPLDTPLSIGNTISNSFPFSVGRRNDYYTSGETYILNAGFTDGAVQLGFFGAWDVPYILWASTNLVNWVPINSAPTISTSPELNTANFQITDAAVTNFPIRFYQITQP